MIQVNEDYVSKLVVRNWELALEWLQSKRTHPLLRNLKEDAMQYERIRGILLKKAESAAATFAKSLTDPLPEEEALKKRERKYFWSVLENFRCRDILKEIRREEKYELRTADEWDEESVEESPQSDFCAYAVLEALGLNDSDLELAKEMIFFSGPRRRRTSSATWDYWRLDLQPRIRQLLIQHHPECVPEKFLNSPPKRQRRKTDGE